MVELDHPTLIHMLGHLSVRKWADAIRNKEVDVDLAYQLLKIQDDRYHGNMVDDVKEVVAMTKEEYHEWRKATKDE
jgi:hypothetical protein